MAQTDKDNKLRIISKRKIREYAAKNAQAELPLTEWYYKMKDIQPKNLQELRRVFNSIDAVSDYTVFNIGGNNYRLIAAMHYNRQCCYIRRIWTHAEYDKFSNRQKLKRGEL